MLNEESITYHTKRFHRQEELF